MYAICGQNRPPSSRRTRRLPRTLDAGAPPEHPTPDPDGSRLVLPEQGSEIGALRLLSYAPQTQEAVDFLIYVNEEQFHIREENGLYSIRNNSPLPDGFPECGLDIAHLAGTSPDEAIQLAAESLGGRYTEIFQEDESTVFPQCLYLRASAGTDWDSEQARLWFVSDGQGGLSSLPPAISWRRKRGWGCAFRIWFPASG